MTKIDRRKLTDLTPDRNNANAGTERGAGMLETSVRELGLGRSIVVDKNGNVIAGNKTLEAAVERGIEDAVIVHTRGDELVVVQRDDMYLYDDDPNNPARRYAYLDNRVAEVNLAYEPQQLLADQEAGFNFDAMFYPEELMELLPPESQRTPNGSDSDGAAAINRAAQLLTKYDVQRGQLWQIGRHRILCGDSYSLDDVTRLTAGFTPDMLHTDPPYGINAVDASRVPQVGSGTTSGLKHLAPGFARGSTRKGGKSRTAIIVQPSIYPVIEGDDRPFDPTPFLGLAPIVILWGANNYADKLPISQSWICWDKREDITRNDFSDCELAWCNSGKTARCFHHLWNGLHKGSQIGEARIHPTEKPVALFAEVGKHYCKDAGVWLDLFAGSGAQLVAAEETGATCLGLEYEPLYVACIIERLVERGLTAELVS